MCKQPLKISHSIMFIKIKSKIKNYSMRALINIATSKYLFESIAQNILKHKGYLFLNINSHESNSVTLEPQFSDTLDSYSIEPVLYQNHVEKKLTELIFPSIKARLFKDAKIKCATCSIVVNNYILIPHYYYTNRSHILFNSDGISFINNDIALFKMYDEEKLSKGIALVGLGSFNWYHWLIEILPAAMLAGKLNPLYSDYNFLVPIEYEKYQSYRESLDIFLGGRNVTLLLPKKQYHVENLIFIDSPVHGPFNLNHGFWPKITDYKQNAEVLIEFRQKIINALLIAEAKPNGLYFVARGNSRRGYNQDELIAVAQSMGLTVVYPEQLSFREQVQLFNSAKLIVGASGGAWANILFCQANSIGLTWIFHEFNGFCVYSNLANIVGCKLLYLFIKGAEPLKSTGVAYNMPYHVDLDIFKNTLQALVKQAKDSLNNSNADVLPQSSS